MDGCTQGLRHRIIGHKSTYGAMVPIRFFGSSYRGGKRGAIGCKRGLVQGFLGFRGLLHKGL